MITFILSPHNSPILPSTSTYVTNRWPPCVFITAWLPPSAHTQRMAWALWQWILCSEADSGVDVVGGGDHSCIITFLLMYNSQTHLYSPCLFPAHSLPSNVFLHTSLKPISHRSFREKKPIKRQRLASLHSIFACYQYFPLALPAEIIKSGFLTFHQSSLESSITITLSPALQRGKIRDKLKVGGIVEHRGAGKTEGKGSVKHSKKKEKEYNTEYNR